MKKFAEIVTEDEAKSIKALDKIINDFLRFGNIVKDYEYDDIKVEYKKIDKDLKALMKLLLRTSA